MRLRQIAQRRPFVSDSRPRRSRPGDI
jgi:hypothetical protein